MTGRRVLVAVTAAGFAAVALLIGAAHSAHQAAQAERLIVCRSTRSEPASAHAIGEHAASATVTCTKLSLAGAGPGLLAWGCVLLVLVIALAGFLGVRGTDRQATARQRRRPFLPEKAGSESPPSSDRPPTGIQAEHPLGNPDDSAITQQRNAAVTRLAELLPHLPGSLASATESALRRAGATVLSPRLGDRFDPGWQEAVGRSDAEPGCGGLPDTVTRVMAPAVLDGEYVLLPARVVVGVSPARDPGQGCSS